jgi:beta-aspartyl-peptidase (threonine type)
MSDKSPTVILANCEGGVGMKAAQAGLERGGTALDAVEAGIRVAEADVSVDSVGRGGAPDLLGVVSCDAAVMDGATGRAGAVGNMRYFIYAVSVARQVMERLPHVMLVSEGAERFAREIGAERAEMLTEEARGRYERWMMEHAPASVRANPSGEELVRLVLESSRDKTAGGTVVFLSRDGNGDIAVGTSTSRWAQRYPGRLGAVKPYRYPLGCLLRRLDETRWRAWFCDLAVKETCIERAVPRWLATPVAAQV